MKAEIYKSLGEQIIERSREKITYTLDRNKIFVTISYADCRRSAITKQNRVPGQACIFRNGIYKDYVLLLPACKAPKLSILW
jgi:hypothetical protein